MAAILSRSQTLFHKTLTLTLSVVSPSLRLISTTPSLSQQPQLQEQPLPPNPSSGSPLYSQNWRNPNPSPNPNPNPSLPRTLAGSPLSNPSLSHLRPPSSTPPPYQSLFQQSPSSSSQFHPLFPNPNVKRAPPAKPPSGPAAAAASNTTPSSSSFKSAELTPAARRKKRKLPDKHLPDRVAALLPESALYTQLLEFESRIDSALTRKKLDIQDSLKNPPSLQRTLRIYVFNTYDNQTRTPGPKAEPPSWSLKIIGRILDDASDTEPPKPNSTCPKFSSFFKRVTVSLDPALYPDNPTIIWENSRSPAPLEGFEIKRKGDKEFTVSVRLEMNYTPEKFKLSQALVEVLGIEVDTRARIIAGIWHYVKAKKLQNPSDPSFFACDPLLKKVFGEEKMRFSLVSQKISQHLSRPLPIQLEHKIRLSGNSSAGNVCYDVLVDVPFPLQKEIAGFLANTEKHKDIEACDEVICASIKKIHEHRRRRAFFLGFSQSPVEFINALIASQNRDLKLVAGEAGRNAEKERRSDFYNQPWVEDAVIRYLNRKPSGGSDAPGST